MVGIGIANSTTAPSSNSNTGLNNKRRKRSATAPSGGNMLPGATNSHPPNASELLRQYNSSGDFNHSAVDMNALHGSNAVFLGAVVYHKTELLLTNLKHFQEYSIEVVACHEYEESSVMNEGKEMMKRCSNRAITTARTLPNGKVHDSCETWNLPALLSIIKRCAEQFYAVISDISLLDF